MMMVVVLVCPGQAFLLWCDVVAHQGTSPRLGGGVYWVLAKGFNVSYSNKAIRKPYYLL